MNYSPIALFVYNRLDHTQRTVEALKKNILANDSDLIIFSDAAKTLAQLTAVNEVRNYINEVTGFKSLTVIQRTENLGLAQSIIGGVTQVCNEYGQVIVVEDDLVTSKYFLKFMNDGLKIYKHNPRVASIHGYVYPVDTELMNTFFLRGADCWGWATWKRAWDMFEPDGNHLLAELKRRRLTHKFNLDGAYDYMRMLKDQTIKKNNSWAVRWHASTFLKDYLTLYPGKSLVSNIGFDYSGTHCAATSEFDVELFEAPIEINEIDISESVDARKAIIGYMKKHKSTFALRVFKKLQKTFGISQKI